MSKLKPLGDSFIGRSAAHLYGAVTSFRNRWYDSHPPQKLPFPVVSVGGISAGGTGKTPLTALIIEHCISRGFTPILFSRGYGRTTKTTQIVPANRNNPLWNEVGDEPAMLRNRYPELWLAIDGNRNRAVQELLPQLPEKAVGIMDDGFQHRKMHRDLNIVTLPDSIMEDAMIPQGLLRESLNSLGRADIICIVSNRDDFDTAPLKLFSREAEFGVIHTKHGSLHNPFRSIVEDSLTEPVSAFCGIARPERFRNSLQEVCKNVINFRSFPDHHIYSESDLRLFETDTTSAIITTEKDWIRTIGKNTAINEKLWYLTITQQFAGLNFKNRFYDLIDNCLEHRYVSSSD